MCNSRFRQESKSFEMLAVLNAILSKGSRFWDKGSVKREILTRCPFYNGKADFGPNNETMDRGSYYWSKVVYQLDINESNHTHTSKSPYGFNKHQQLASVVCLSTFAHPFQCSGFNLPYLLHVSCYINAHWWKETLPPWIPLCCIGYKNHDLLYCDKGQAQKAAK